MKKKEILLKCPHCTTEFVVEIFSTGDCPNCKKMHYEWDFASNEDVHNELGLKWEPILE